MIHFGDITKISGYDVPIVDCVIGGSPCQDLSVAGKRAGLDGERSGLFMEQLRIIKEMRDKDARSGRTDEFIRPRFMVWENVPGAFSSNKGQDFRVVLEETAKVVDKDAVIPMPPKNKWSTSGCIVGDGWSIAWRILDAQFWGVPQRRRRIALVADFGGGCAQEILFVRKGLQGDSSESGTERQSPSSDAQGCIGVYDRTGRKSISFEPGIASREGGHIYEDVSGTLRANAGDNQMAVAYSIENHPADSRVNIDESGVVQTLTSRMGTGGGNVPMVLECYNQCTTGDKAKALTNKATDSDHVPEDKANCLVVGTNPGFHNGVCYVVDQGGEKSGANVTEGLSPTLTCTHGGDPVICLQGNCIDRTDTAGCNGKGWKEGTCYTLNTIDRPAEVYQKPHYIVRRLTPMECERLQGYPDGWTDIGEYTDSKGKRKNTSDSARYKALGNSIALPPWKWIIKRISALYERDATLASLFDGICGFPLLWEQINGKGSAIWASEIEDFPIAVTKKRIE